MLKLVKARRTIRFFEQKPVPEEVLRHMIDGARVTSCAGNMQQLRYVVVTTPDTAEQVFAQTAWAAMVRPKRNPEWGKNAAPAYIAVLGPSDAAPIIHADAGAAIQSMQLIAEANGLGSCWLGAIQREPLRKILQVSLTGHVSSPSAPLENPPTERFTSTSLRYYLGDQDVLHPKLALLIARWWSKQPHTDSRREAAALAVLLEPENEKLLSVRRRTTRVVSLSKSASQASRRQSSGSHGSAVVAGRQETSRAGRQASTTR